MPSPAVQTITVQELRQRLGGPALLLLLDVREQDEWLCCRIDGARHVPMSQFSHRLEELDPTLPIVVYCQHGVRSHHVAQFLIGRGFTDVANLSGGIDAWSVQIDPAVPRY